MPNKVIRYIVYIQNQEYQASYNTSFGEKTALTWAKLTAERFHGLIQVEYTDGTKKDIRNYSKYRE